MENKIMATRSLIIRKNETGKYEGIYCHWDGSPDSVGRTLLDHYSDAAKLADLIKLGDISSLGPKVAPEESQAHSYSAPCEGVTVAYHRDRGEEYRGGCSAESLPAIIEILNAGQEYVYVFEAGDWYVNGESLKSVIGA